MSRWIDADALKDKLQQHHDFWVMAWGGFSKMPISDKKRVDEITNCIAEVVNAPTIDIVRCQDCKYWVYHFNGCARNPCTEPWYATDFCNYGEREGE